MIGVFLSTTAISRSLGMVISVSTRCCSPTMPSSADFCRLAPSKRNGLVTTPMVSAPDCRAISATTGAAPVPVPPPMPAVTKTMSQSWSSLLSSSRDSSAASAPTVGLPPAPRPRVSLRPMCILTWASLLFSACRSVLMATNSTHRRPPP